MRMRMAWPTNRAWWRSLQGAGLLALLGLAFAWGRYESMPHAAAEPTVPVPTPPPPAPSMSSEYSQRVVAYFNGNVPVTREMLGEYLIARYGGDRLPLLVNKLIIEDACRKANITVEAAEVDAALTEDLKGLNNLPLKDFVSQMLKPYNKTLYEWKEDVLRPKLLMTKLVQKSIQVTEQDYQMAFQAYYGEKIACRIILWPKGQKDIAMKQFETIRQSEQEFDHAARSQANPKLASGGGRVDPIGRYTTGNETLEKEIFSLKPGELSSIIDTPDGPVLVKCDSRIPPDKTKNLEAEKPKLYKEIFDKKVQREIPIAFEQLKAKAKPNLLLKSFNSVDDVVRDAKEEISRGPMDGLNVPKTATPKAN